MTNLAEPLLGSLPPFRKALSRVVDEKDHDRILSPFKKVLKWIEDVKEATAPHFDEVHTTLYNVKEMMKQQRSAAANPPSEK
nr:glutathione S-transferase T1-like [Ipomoea batatas]